METKSTTKSTAPGSQDEKLTCWQAATNPQCLRVETKTEIQLLPYGYFQQAIFSRKDNVEFLVLHFGNTSVRVLGKRLGSLVTALARFGVEQINILPEKYVTKSSESVITEIEITEKSNPNVIQNATE